MWSEPQGHEAVSSPVPLLHWPSTLGVTVRVFLCHKIEVDISACVSLDYPVKVKRPSIQQKTACQGASVVHSQQSWAPSSTSHF